MNIAHYRIILNLRFMVPLCFYFQWERAEIDWRNRIRPSKRTKCEVYSVSLIFEGKNVIWEGGRWPKWKPRPNPCFMVLICFCFPQECAGIYWRTLKPWTKLCLVLVFWSFENKKIGENRKSGRNPKIGAKFEIRGEIRNSGAKSEIRGEIRNSGRNPKFGAKSEIGGEIWNSGRNSGRNSRRNGRN